MVGERDRDREAVRWATGESTPLQTNNGVLQMVGQLQGGQAAGQQQICKWKSLLLALKWISGI